MEPRFTVIVPTLNNIEGLVKMVESLYKYTSVPFRIISIFNGTDEDFDKARTALDNKVHLWVKPYRNLGFGKSMNQGIKLATTEYVIIANDDVEVLYPTWWEEVEQLFKDKPELGGFNPHSFINKAASGDRVCQYDIKDEYSQEDIDKMKEIFRGERWYVGCCTYFTICRRTIFDKIGLFDESFGPGSGEDYDLCIRAARQGFLIAGGSTVMVKHWWGATKDNLPKSPEFTSNYDLIVKGNQLLTKKWGPHCEELQRQLKDGRITEEEAKQYNGGWSVSGNGGPDEPLDQDTAVYHDKKWFQEKEL